MFIFIDDNCKIFELIVFIDDDVFSNLIKSFLQSSNFFLTYKNQRW
jgi:hypothetical protein